MGLPNVIINFKSTGTTAIQRGDKGIVALILTDDTNQGFMQLETIKDIPGDLSKENKEYIERAFIGGMSVPKKVLLYVLANGVEDYNEAFTFLETVSFDYLVGPHDMSSDLANKVATWIKSQRDTLDKKVKAILPSIAADHEGIINFDTTNIKVGETTFTNTQYCSRIAGLIAGTPMKVSCTFTPLPEVTDVPRMTNSQLSAEIDKGKFLIFHDGEKVKVARGVNSLVTTNSDKSTEFKKIKVVDILDLIHTDIKKTANDNFIGKFPNNYDNKCILITAIKSYYEVLESDELLEKGVSDIEIDISAQSSYLKATGLDISEMSEYEIKSANTDDKVFLSSNIRVLDAIEDITINIAI